jgi:hypothetical protein
VAHLSARAGRSRRKPPSRFDQRRDALRRSQPQHLKLLGRRGSVRVAAPQPAKVENCTQPPGPPTVERSSTRGRARCPVPPSLLRLLHGP